MTQSLESILPIMVEAGYAGGESLRHYFGAEIDVVEKSMASDYCTTADLEAEKAILKTLRAQFPDYNYFSEEAGPDYKNSDFTFLIDPLDGTNNFVLGNPYFSVAIALTEWNTTKLGVVYNPILNIMYHATKGGGAFIQEKSLRVSTETDIERSTIAYAAGYAVDTERMLRIESAIKRKEAKRVTINWSVALDFCALAVGKIEGIIIHDTSYHDYMAGRLIAQEAGAVVYDFAGNKNPSDKVTNFVIANNETIARHLLDVVKFY